MTVRMVETGVRSSCEASAMNPRCCASAVPSRSSTRLKESPTSVSSSPVAGTGRRASGVPGVMPRACTAIDVSGRSPCRPRSQPPAPAMDNTRNRPTIATPASSCHCRRSSSSVTATPHQDGFLAETRRLERHAPQTAVAAAHCLRAGAGPCEQRVDVEAARCPGQQAFVGAEDQHDVPGGTGDFVGFTRRRVERQVLFELFDDDVRSGQPQPGEGIVGADDLEAPLRPQNHCRERDQRRGQQAHVPQRQAPPECEHGVGQSSW